MLTPTLNASQLKDNIDALQKGGLSTDKIQSYVNNYKADGNGGYVLASAQPAAPAPQPDVAQSVVNDTQTHAGNIAQDVTSGVQAAKTDTNPVTAVVHAAGSGLDIAGNVAGEAGDLLGEGLKAITPQPVKDALSSVAKTAAATPAAKSVLSAWNAFEAQHPDIAKGIGNVVNIAALFGGGEAGKAAAPAIEDGVAAAKDAASSGLDTAGSAAKTAVTAPITAARDMATPIEKNVLTVLKNPTADTEGTLKSLFTKAKNAVTITGAETPFDSVGKSRLGGALKTLNTRLTGAGEKLANTLAMTGKSAVDVSPVMQEFESGLPDRLGTVIDKEGNFADAAGRVSLIRACFINTV